MEAKGLKEPIDDSKNVRPDFLTLHKKKACDDAPASDGLRESVVDAGLHRGLRPIKRTSGKLSASSRRPLRPEIPPKPEDEMASI